MDIVTQTLSPVVYKPVEERTVDLQFREMLATVRDDGWWGGSPQDERSRNYVQYAMKFDLANGFPMMTERDMMAPIGRGEEEPWPSMFHQGISELTAFLNGATTQEELESYGCFWWRRWLTPEKCAKRGLASGDNGPGSYGAVFTKFPTHPDGPYEGRPYDQIEGVLQQMKAKPNLKTHRISNWLTPCTMRENQRVVVAPCHGDLHFIVNTEAGLLSLHHVQRSMDMLVGGIVNICQYAALLMVFAQILDLQAHELAYTVSLPHYFEGQVNALDKILKRQPRCFPTVNLNTRLTSPKDMRPEHFDVSDYHPHPGFRIPTPV